jgi:sphingomyelin phosphodiesterase acid-like 3
MRRAVPNPAVVVLPGDFFMHHYPRTAPRSDVLQRVVRDFDRAYPHAQFAIVLGNNDSACGDYRSELRSADLAAMARAWAPLVDRNGAAPDFARGFARAGHYTARLPLGRLRLVALDSVVFSSLYRGDCNAALAPAGNELGWLRATLAATPAGERNVVEMHVPPGYDVFATEMAHGFVPWPLMQPRYGVALAKALALPADRVAFAIAGHEHHFDVRLSGEVPIVALGSISPVYGNAPAFYALRVDDTGRLRDLRVWAFDRSTRRWLPPRDFDRLWGVTSLDADAVRTLHRRLGQDAGLRADWEAFSNAWSPAATPGEIWGKHWRVPWCAQVRFGPGFESCAGLERRAGAARLAIAAAIGGLFAMVALAVVLIGRRARTVR